MKLSGIFALLAVGLLFNNVVVAQSESAQAKKAPAKAEPANLLKKTNDAKSWRLEQHESGKGSMAVDGAAVKFSTTTVSNMNWHVQAFMVGLDLKEGQKYQLKFKIKSDNSQKVSLSAMVDVEDWHDIGLYEEFTTTKEFKEHTYTFMASGVESKKNRVGFALGHGTGNVWIRDMTLISK